eukprot:667337-Rhodomonas_salina.1
MKNLRRTTVEESEAVEWLEVLLLLPPALSWLWFWRGAMHTGLACRALGVPVSARRGQMISASVLGGRHGI